VSKLTLPDWREHKALVVLIALWLTLPALGGFTLVAMLADASEWLRGRGPEALPIFIALFAISTGLGLLPPYAQSILGGWVFGAVGGTLGITAGLVGGAAIGWTVGRFAAGSRVVAWLDSQPKSRVVRAALVESSPRRTLGLLFLVRLPPNSPFAMANLMMSAAGVRLVPLLVATAFGMLPRTIALATAAAAAASTGASDLPSLVREQGWVWLAIGLAALVIALAVIARIARSALARAGLGA
jgi:uncharacterized membrane protein YdjX (TVP38/TMEM64 family)